MGHLMHQEMHLNHKKKKKIKLINQKNDLINSQLALQQPIITQLISVHIMVTIKASVLPLELLPSPF